MNNYEVMYIVKPVEEEAFEALVAKFDNLINNNGGTVVKELDRVMKITDEILRHMIIRKGE